MHVTSAHLDITKIWICFISAIPEKNTGGGGGGGGGINRLLSPSPQVFFSGLALNSLLN